MKRFINNNCTGKRDYECTNVVACLAQNAPDANWIECTPEEWQALEAKGMNSLGIEENVRYFGWL